MKMTMAQSNTRQIGNGEVLPRRAAIIFIVFLTSSACSAT